MFFFLLWALDRQVISRHSAIVKVVGRMTYCTLGHNAFQTTLEHVAILLAPNNTLAYLRIEPDNIQ